MNFNNISFILHKPQLSENIGLCARAMKNFGFKNLSVIEPKPIFPNDKIIATSVGAKDIIKKTKVYSNLEKSLTKTDILIATTVRKRDFHIPSIKLQDISKLNPNKISILFGQENNGLTNKEISHANYILSIPTKSNSSLNLSHTVALIAYELSQMSFSKISSSKIVTPASAKDIEKFLSFLMKILEKRKFTSISSKRDNLEISLRNFLKTSKIDQKQIKTVYGVLKFITK